MNIWVVGTLIPLVNSLFIKGSYPGIQFLRNKITSPFCSSKLTDFDIVVLYESIAFSKAFNSKRALEFFKKCFCFAEIWF